MRFLWKLMFLTLGNFAGLIGAGHYIPGFSIPSNFYEVALLAGALTILNLLLRPVLRLFMGPIIVLTLGLGTILVNALILGLLDILAPGLNIQGIVPLISGTFVLAVVNFLIHLIAVI